MFAFLRVIVIYLGLAALLTWGLFALGWADAFELPGFEGSRVPVASAPIREAVVRIREAIPASTQRHDEAGKPEPQPEPEPKRVVIAPPAPQPKAVPPSHTEPAVVAPVPSAVPPPIPQARVEVAVSPPVVEPPRRVEQPAANPVPAAPAPTPPKESNREPNREAKASEPVVLPLPVAPAPPRQPAVAPPAPSPPRTADVAPVRPTPPPAARPVAPPVRPAASAETATRSWAPVHRLAGFGAEGLAAQLANKRRARDDIACVMFRNVVFKAGTTIYQSSARADLEMVAKALKSNTDQRVEIGSRLGPGRPMASDPKLRLDRANLLRQSLISLGVAPARLAIDTAEAYERVAEDVARVNGGRVQSMGVCVYPA